MDFAKVAVTEMARLAALEKGQLPDLPEDRRDPHRRLDIAAFANMVDVVAVIDDQGNRVVEPGNRGRRRLRPVVAWCAQAEGPIADGVDHPADIVGGTAVAVFPLQDRPHDLFQPGGIGKREASEPVEHQIRTVGIAGVDRGFIGGADDRPGTEALVEAQARHVLSACLLVRAQRRIIGKTFEIEAFGAERQRLLADPLVKCRTDTAAHQARGGRDDVQIGEAEVGRMQEDGHRLEPGFGVLGDQKLAQETVFEGIADELRKPGDIAFRHAGELRPDDGPGGGDGGSGRGARRLGDLQDAQHRRSVPSPVASARMRAIMAS